MIEVIVGLLIGIGIEEMYFNKVKKTYEEFYDEIEMLHNEIYFLKNKEIVYNTTQCPMKLAEVEYLQQPSSICSNNDIQTINSNTQKI